MKSGTVFEGLVRVERERGSERRERSRERERFLFRFLLTERKTERNGKKRNGSEIREAQ